MPTPNYYQTGTITLTSGSEGFTTSGAALQSVEIRAGDVIIANGLSLPIASITGENAGTLLDPCPAAAAGTLPVRIAFQNDTKRFHAWAVWLRDKLSIGHLMSFAEMPLAQDKIPYTTTGGGWSLSNLSTFGRNLIASSSASAARTALGASTVGSSIFAAANEQDVRTALGASTVGSALFAAVDASAARTALGASTVGASIFTADDAATARTAIGIGPSQVFPATGIKLTTTPSSDPNTLDAYEEGSWTPSLVFNGGSSGMTYSSRSGQYTRIGRTVFFDASFNLSAKGSSTGSAVIRGLPFSGQTYGAGGAFGFSFTGLTGAVTIYIAASELALYQANSGGFSTMDHTSFTNDTAIRVSGFYRV